MKEAQYEKPVQKYPYEEKAGDQQGTKPDLGTMMLNSKFRKKEAFDEKDDFFEWLDQPSNNMPVNICVKAMKQVDEDDRVKFKKHRNMNDVNTKDMMSQTSYTVLVILAVLMMMLRLVPIQQRFKEEHNCDKECRSFPHLKKLVVWKRYLCMVLGIYFNSLKMLISNMRRSAIQWTIKKL